MSKLTNSLRTIFVNDEYVVSTRNIITFNDISEILTSTEEGKQFVEKMFPQKSEKKVVIEKKSIKKMIEETLDKMSIGETIVINHQDRRFSSIQPMVSNYCKQWNRRYKIRCVKGTKEGFTTYKNVTRIA
jgi:hypothetical protein